MNNYAFIDSQNVNLAIRDQGWQLDFGKFRKYLLDKYDIKKAFLFIGYVSSNWKLYRYLRNAGYLIIFKPISKSNDGTVKGNVDAELVLWAVKEIPNYDKAIIISGDGDFYCLVKYLMKKGKLLRLMVPDRIHRSSLFKKFFLVTVFMNDLKKRLELKRKYF